MKRHVGRQQFASGKIASLLKLPHETGGWTKTGKGDEDAFGFPHFHEGDTQLAKRRAERSVRFQAVETLRRKQRAEAVTRSP